MIDESMDDQSFASESSLQSVEPPSADDDDDEDFELGTKSKKRKAPKSLTKSTTKQAVKKHTVAKASKPSKPTKPKAASKKTSGARSAGDKVKGDPKENICNGLLELQQFGIVDASKVHTALFAGYKNMRSAGFTNALKALKNESKIEFPAKDTIRLTTKGASSSPAVPAFKTNEEALLRLTEITKKVCGKKGPKADKICSFLSDGREHSLKDVAAASGYGNLRSEGLTSVLAELGKLGLIVREPGKSGTIKLADMAFPCGRPGAGGKKETDDDDEE